MEHEIIRNAQENKSFLCFESETLFKLAGIKRFPFSSWLKDKLIDLNKEKNIVLTPNMEKFLIRSEKIKEKEFYFS